MAYLQLPNGRYLEIPEGMSPEEAYAKAQKAFPTAFDTSEKPAKRGLGAALGKGTESFLGSVGTAGKALFGDENLAAQEALAKREELGKKYAEQVSLDKLKEVYEKQGLIAAGKELAGQVPLAIAEQLPNIGATLAGAKLGAMGGSAVMPGVGTVIGGVAGAVAPSLLSLAGSNIQRQAEVQQDAGQPFDVSTGKAFGAAVPQAALDVAATFIPLGGKVAGKVFGPEVEKLLMRGGTEAAEKLAQETFKKTLGKGLAIGAAAEIPTEIAQQMLERAQAGLDLTSPDALKEYGETAYQVGLLAPIGAGGRFIDKSGARTQVEQQEKAKADEIAEQQRAAKEVADKIAADELASKELVEQQQKTGDIFGEEVKAEELKSVKAAREAAEAEVAPEVPRVEIARQRDLLTSQLETLEKQRDAAAEKGDTTAFAALVKQTAQLQTAVSEAEKQLKAMPIEMTPEMEMAKARGELKNLTKQLSKQVGPAYDAKVASGLAEKIETTQKRIEELAPAASQMDMFDPAMMAAEQKAVERTEKEARAQEQADLLAQQAQPKLVKADEYLQGLQDLEDAYAEGKSERIIEELVAKLQQVGQEKEAGKVGIVGGAEQEGSIERINRIKRAIKAEEAKLETAKSNEEVATIRADIDALNKRLGIALTESATPQAENERANAEADAREAVDTFSFAINDIRSGDYLNGRDVTTAASFRSGLEKQAYDAASAYIDASIRDVNAQRRQANQAALSTDEALKLTNDLSSFFKKSVDSKQPNVRKSLDQIKNKYTKGAPLRKAGPFQLRQEFAPKKLEAEPAPKPDGLTPREREAGVKPREGGVSPDQKDLFAPADLEPVAVTRATPQNFIKFLGSATVMRAKAKLAALEEQAKKMEQTLSVKSPQVDKDFMAQLEAQRRFVLEVVNQDKIVSDLRAKAAALWTGAAGDNARLKTIDDLHAKANELINADLKFEKTILNNMERKLDKMPKASPAALKLEKDMARARSQTAQTEELQQKMLEKQSVEERKAEQRFLEVTQGLPKTRQEIIETNRALPGADEKIKVKRVSKVEAAKPLAEKRAKVVETEKELAEERKAFREQTSKGMTPQQLENTIKEFKAQAEASRKKGNEAAAKRQEATAKRLEKELKSKMDVARMAMRGKEERKTAQPPKMKTGVAPESRGRKAKKDFEEDALEHGVKFEDYEFVRQGLAFGFKARDEAAKTGAGVSQADANKALDKVKLPKGLKVVVVNKLQGNLRDAVEAQGMNPDTVRGGVMPNGVVFMVAENHTDLKDFAKTIAHEITGHLGVEGLLGESGMNALVKKVTSQYGSVWKLADTLGVTDDVVGAYQAAKRIGRTEEQALGSAVREMIAHTEEARIDKGTLGKINEFIKAMVGAVRSALRKIGVDLDISTSDIFKLLRDARKDFNEAAPGAYVNKDGDIVFRDKPAQANAGFQYVLNSTDGVVASQKPWYNRIRGEATGLIFRTKYIDRFAPVEKVLEKAKDSLKATQLMYFLRMHDQRMAWTSEIASNGPAVLEEKTRKDGGKEFIIESKEGVNLAKVAEALRGADVGNSEATNRVFTMYLLAKRAKRVGLDKLNFSGKVTQQMLDNTLQAVEANEKTKEAFKKAADIYNEYNKGLVNFAVQTGAISKDVAKKMLESEDYVPFYRQTDNGEVFLDIGGAPAIKIGNIKDQPYLNELVGGDQPILDFFTSSLQNTAMLTDMSLRNLATRNVAFALGDLGLLKVGEKEKGVGIRKGDGPASATTIRFKLDGENYFAQVDSDAAGVPAELLVKGLEGVNTALPTAVKLMNIPANLLRKWVTRNPAYALRQVVRDPLNAVMVSGANTIPIVSSFKEIAKMVKGKSEGEPLLQRRGILGGQVLTGTAEDQKKILNDITSGKKGWDYRMAQLDQLAIQGDAATRVVMYNSFIKQGLSEMEATLATLEAMNFSKRGISASLFQLSTMVPFMNAQIQGLNVLYQAYKGKMPFNDKLKVKQKLVQRGLMMAGFSMLYAAAMQDDEAYQNANDDEKYANWFIYSPLSEEPVKVPIPFELGLIFKAVPEALVNTMFGDAKARDTMGAIAKMGWSSVPITGPQGVKPILETAINYSFFTGREIESKRLQQLDPTERYGDRTTEAAKFIGGILGNVPILGERFFTPTKIDYLVRGYTGTLPLAVASLANPVLRGGESGEQPESRGVFSSETPLIGTFFQPRDAAGLVTKAYKDMDEITEARATYKKMVGEGREAEAEAYLEANADSIAMGSFAGRFRKKMGDYANMERAIRLDGSLSAAEKREQLDEIRQLKIELAKALSSARE
jgi:hypothetical protein